ncbi:MAG: transposase, partial [Planctomycetaceae bacterium]|nr:transposase [Planctomycetaceae bacterium]
MDPRSSVGACRDEVARDTGGDDRPGSRDGPGGPGRCGRRGDADHQGRDGQIPQGSPPAQPPLPSQDAPILRGYPVIRKSCKLLPFQEVRGTHSHKDIPRCVSPTPPTSPTSSGRSSRPLIPVNTVGRPRTVEMREVLNVIFSLNRSGCQWDMLPHDLPPRSTVHDSYDQWRGDGTWQALLDALRQKVRVAAGK